MDTRDNELDKLFQSALDGHEIEPSAVVWQGVTSRLDADKRKRLLIPYLSIAACIILLVTAGILFVPKPVKVSNEQTTDRIAKNSRSVKRAAIIKADANEQPVDQQNKKTSPAVIAPVNRLAQTKLIKANKNVINKAVVVHEQKNYITKQDSAVQLAFVNRGNDLENPTVPDLGDVTKPAAVDAPVLKNKVVLVAMQLPGTNNKPVTIKPVKRHRIRSLGDVFNVMIAAVDKREDKIIEFSNTDEDDATITGVNLGIIKVKKEK
ncbi:hypothetical protein SNE25_07695 [Mucilaginibacter sabulilitoris]|uniref:Uncharacterized protein n=1 Tax=Mucilaginibacter sabulilitoris TaxID=1173583 RepID=A0ABZ0TUE2_9SPHI|nr:hypothetical protein [Mucilaginibacter sabulilitoris]WPU95404.1 hypothetical protein SNE25_07695 [Mucilaginibacter sabulilitoris]